MSAAQLTQYAISGLMNGSIYALVAIGMTLSFNGSGIVDLAQGQYVMLGGLLAASMSDMLIVPLVLAVPAAIVGTGLIGGLMETVFIEPRRHVEMLRLILITLGISISLEALALIIFGHDPLWLPSFSGESPVRLPTGGTIVPQVFWIWGTLGLVVVGLHQFYGRSRWGRAMLACAINPEAAAIVGVNVRSVVFASFVLAAAFGSVGGVLITPITSMGYGAGFIWTLKGFAAAVLGGMGSTTGALAGGLLLGLSESFATALFPSGYRDAFTLGLLILVLFVRPRGLLGGRAA